MCGKQDLRAASSSGEKSTMKTASMVKRYCGGRGLSELGTITTGHVQLKTGRCGKTYRACQNIADVFGPQEINEGTNQLK